MKAPFIIKMKKTKEQILRDCTNEHDRKLMIKEFDRSEKIYNKSILLMGISLFFTTIGIGGIFLISDYFILSFIPVFPLMFWAQLNLLKGSGLI